MDFINKWATKLGISPKCIKKITATQQDLLETNYYIFTGKGLRNEFFHLGHLYIYQLINKISYNLDSLVLFQISGDEKRQFQTPYLTLKQCKTYEEKLVQKLSLIKWYNLKVFSNLQLKNIPVLKNCADFINSKLTLKKINQVFGNISIASAYYVGIQLAPILLMQKLYPALRPILIVVDDQVGFFSLFRDLCTKFKMEKPPIVLLKDLKGLNSSNKMSSSEPKKAITMDSLNLILKGFSDPSGLKDYGLHLLDFFYHSELKNSRKFFLGVLRKWYLKHKNSETFKKYLIKYFLLKLKEVYPLKVLPFFEFDSLNIDHMNQIQDTYL